MNSKTSRWREVSSAIDMTGLQELSGFARTQTANQLTRVQPATVIGNRPSTQFMIYVRTSSSPGPADCEVVKWTPTRRWQTGEVETPAITARTCLSGSRSVHY